MGTAGAAEKSRGDVKHTMTHKEIERVYALYADYADHFEKRVREHIKRKVNHSDLCEVT